MKGLPVVRPNLGLQNGLAPFWKGSAGVHPSTHAMTAQADLIGLKPMPGAPPSCR
jgi:hypothetical protein